MIRSVGENWNEVQKLDKAGLKKITLLYVSCGTSTICFHSTLRPPDDSARIVSTDCFISCRPTCLPFTVTFKSLEKVSSSAWINSSLDDDSKMARMCSCDHWVRDESSAAFSVGWVTISRERCGFYDFWVSIFGRATKLFCTAAGKNAFAKDPHPKFFIILFSRPCLFLQEFQP